jgi:hypothetical protein
MRASNLPGWLIDQTLNSLCNLTNNSIYTKDRRYCHTEGQWGINGTMDQMWHARQINTMVVTELTWQELEYWGRTQKTSPAGQIHHDFSLEPNIGYVCPWDDQNHRDYRNIDKWVDLNCGFIVSVYEAFIATDNHTRLDQLWPYVKLAAQRVVDQSTEYPRLFEGTENSYDAGGDADLFNDGMSIAAYRIMQELATVQNDTILRNTYSTAFETARQSFAKRHLTSNFPAGRICESVMGGQWIGFFLKLGQFFPQANIDYAIKSLDEYYQPLTKGLGFEGGTYDEWPGYLVTHTGGLFLQTGNISRWKALQFDWYERNYKDRNRVFNQKLDIPGKVDGPNYHATSFDCYDQYINVPGLWRNYYDIIGIHRNAHLKELWVEPALPEELNHTLTNALAITPEGYLKVSYFEFGTDFQNRHITIAADTPMTVSKLYVRDPSTPVVSVSVNGTVQSVTRVGEGYAKELAIAWEGSIGRDGIVVDITDTVQAGSVPATERTVGYEPGPMNSLVHAGSVVRIRISEQGKHSLRVIAPTGRCMASFEGEHAKEYSFGSRSAGTILPAGFYTARITNANGVCIKAFVIE